jgi:hypothetical protein
MVPDNFGSILTVWTDSNPGSAQTPLALAETRTRVVALTFQSAMTGVSAVSAPATLSEAAAQETAVGFGDTIRNSRCQACDSLMSERSLVMQLAGPMHATMWPSGVLAAALAGSLAQAELPHRVAYGVSDQISGSDSPAVTCGRPSGAAGGDRETPAFPGRLLVEREVALDAQLFEGDVLGGVEDRDGRQEAEIEPGLSEA